jgi:SulP family sulfate permease
MPRWPACRRSGLYCYLAAGLAYAVFGTSRQLAVGPTSALALAVAAGIAAIALMVGVIAIGGRFLGLANLAYFFSDSVVTGFKTGAALYIASTQLPKLLALEGSGGNFFARLLHVGILLPGLRGRLSPCWRATPQAVTT